MLTAALVFAAVWISVKRKDWSCLKRAVLPFFVLYLCAVLGITVFNRLPFDDARYELEVFWSYRKAATSRMLLWEILLNYLLLLPYGLLAPLYWKKRLTLLTGFLFTLGIELAQYAMRRGLFDGGICFEKKEITERRRPG